MSLMKTVGYVRVSTDRQADQGVSLPAQSEKIRAMAVVQGGELIDVIVDAESAKSLNRPGMSRLLALVDSGAVQAVIVAKLDRLTRIARHRLGRRPAGTEHHDRRFPVGAGSHW
jgi:site-specific DNA recombinase